MLRISSAGVKERLRNLVEMGLMERRRIQAEGQGHATIVKFVLTPEGEKVLTANENRS
jgi:predicted ArsR family transcriptional regulator